MIDKRLLVLEYFLNRQSEHYFLLNIANLFKVSERQVVRTLNKWQEEGWIEYIPGKGRGNPIQINLLFNMEEKILTEFLDNIDEMKIEEIRDFIELPWNERSIHFIQEKVNSLVSGDESLEQLTYVEYIDQLPDTIHPSYVTDYTTSKIVYHIYETLYRVTNDGKIKRNLLHFDEWIENDLNLFLRRDIQYSNGMKMSAQDVRDCLETLMTTGHFVRLFTEFEEIEIVDDFHLILKFNKRPQFFEYRLASRYSGIYKKLPDGDTIGSGPYYLDVVDEETLRLSRNVFYRGNQPDIFNVLLTTNKQKYIASQKVYEQPYTLNVGHEFLLFNPHKKLSIEQRKFLSAIILNTIEHISGHKVETQYELITESIATFNRPLKVIVNQQIKDAMNQIKERLARYKIELIFIEMETEEYLNTHLLTTDADFCWMFESIHYIQPYRLIDLLTQSKFQEWYGEFKDAQRFLSKDYHDSAISVANAYINNLKRQYLLVPIFTHTHTLLFSKQMKNLQQAAYGTLDYRLVINDIE